jgi:aspartyl-tRNA(Asn)/glutamyl-tRNA(Gln) amidotransferase subunit A
LQSYKNNFEKIEKIRSGELSLVDNVKEFIKRINENKNINAFNFLFEEEALQQAEHIESKIKNGSYGKLAGMVIAVKDVLAIKDKPLTCSSNILKNFTSLYTSTAVAKLIEAGAVIIGKTNCDEFAMGSSNENSAFGPVLNPADLQHVPGGSSGGSAAAVAGNLCDASLGTDTGGSIRQPASFCGIYGLKPTYGRVSRYGLTAFASSFDSIGPFAKSVEDIALILEVMAGKDENDSTSADAAVPAYSSSFDFASSQKKPVIGIPVEYLSSGIDKEVEEAVKSAIHKLKSDGFAVKEISLPHTDYSIATYYILTTAEASSNLARYDGARYGFRSKESGALRDMYVNSRTEGFGAEVKRRIMLGTYVLSAGYYDAYYKKAQRVRRLIKEDFDKAFREVDLILTPTSPTAAFKLGEKSADPLQMYLSDIYTVSANLAGIPGISIPIAKNSEGLPIGLQLMANQFNEAILINTSYFIQENYL